MTFEKDKSRIAKNTLLLYCRMFLTMAIGLYTSRIVLNALGVADYGVYNVVGGVVAMLGFFNSSIGTSTQRFINVGMTDKSGVSLTSIFSTAINVHVIIGIITVVLLETIGLWFVVNKLVIPEGQRAAAMWVYQCSVLSFFISIISSPYNAALIAYEKMSAFAMMSIIEVVLKLGIAISLVYYVGEKLIFYALMTLAASVVMRFLYSTYCSRAFKEIRYRFEWNISLIKKMMSFSGWMIFGCLTDMLGTQGINMMINVFFGPLFNAARAVAIQVQSAIASFSTNFMISVNPQIVKSYASEDYDYSYKLVFTASKLSFFLMMIMIVPVILRSEQILTLWLKTVPPDAAIFLNLILIEYLIRSSYTPIAQINQASGNIRVYQLTISCLFLLNFILTYIFFKAGFPVYTTFIISAGIAFVGLFARLTVLKLQQEFPSGKYLHIVTLPIFAVGLASASFSYVINLFTSSGILGFILFVILSILGSSLLIWNIGLNRNEKIFVREKISLLKAKFIHG